ncbi:MAG: transposase [Planctomycetaceae bacterium]|nr:MAG: transposase [Planctomycetaceae bacterium]
MADQKYSFVLGSPPEDWKQWLAWLQLGLHGRSQWRLPLVLTGLLWARQRRTVSSWLRAARLQAKYTDYYYFNGSVGRKTNQTAARLLSLLLRLLPLPERIILALDDSPTARYGPKVEGAGLHHNPTSGPDDHKFIYGHIWVVLALVLRHPLWHAIGLPLLSRLYVKAKDVPPLAMRYGWQFQTKLELGVNLVQWAEKLLAPLQKPIWLVMDGAYAYRPLLKPILAMGVTVVSRLRKDAGLRTLPPPRRPGQRGATRKYGLHKISLAKRAAHRQGWKTIEAVLYGGQRVTKTYKTFLATWPVVGGVIRVVLVREPQGKWDAFFCTDPTTTVRQILECYSDRSAIEQVFHDIKEIWDAGQQQVRNLWRNIGCFHLNLWMHTLVELWAWHRPAKEICNRSDSPWDDPARRPSHADRRKALQQAFLQNGFSRALAKHKIPKQIKILLNYLAQMAG